MRWLSILDLMRALPDNVAKPQAGTVNAAKIRKHKKAKNKRAKQARRVNRGR